MRSTLKGIVIGSGCSMLVLLGANALAGTGIGAVFNLGQVNTVDRSTLVNGTSETTSGGAPQLSASNGSSLAGATGVTGRISSTAPGSNSAGIRGINPGTGSADYGVVGNGGTGVLGQGSDVGGTFRSGNIGLTASGPNDGIQTSATAATKSGLYAHHDGPSVGYGVFARSDNGPALGLDVTAGQAPMTVNSAAKVTNLNADAVDGVGLTNGKFPASALPATTDGQQIYFDCNIHVDCLIPTSGSDKSFTMTNLAAGSYAFFGKVGLYDNSGGNYVECHLNAGGDSDLTQAEVGNGAGDEYLTDASLEVVHTFSGTGSATIGCGLTESAPSAIAGISNVKLIAIKLDALKNSAVSPN
jgi:hypothetical protein